MFASPRISTVGLGYVGLPLAVQLARYFDVVGFDIDGARIAELKSGWDRTGEVDADALRNSSIQFAVDEAALAGTDIFIITVPTPVDEDNQPDLDPVRAATATVGRNLTVGSLVVYESTVYPGVTEDVCGPILEAGSGLTCGTDFFLGYSPERINPGDREHTVDRITKVVAGQTPEVTAQLAAMYGAINNRDIFEARDIRTAEAAKVIENAQRDINIAFVNEVAVIVNGLGLNMRDVLEAANTKWNFLPFQPGLVGGHCIGVDPFYLAHAAHLIGHNPEVVLAGRRINDAMGAYIAGEVDERLARGGARVLLLGLTFKENVPDLRNTRVVDIYSSLCEMGHNVDVHDPHADRSEAQKFFGINLLSRLDDAIGYDAVIGAVCHDEYAMLDTSSLACLLAEGGLLVDIKGMWRDTILPDDYRRWQL
ncbi:MAG: UDP-N-acetyl-D-galactosamine dehydrogenase [Alphaproteobacteria bacterium]|nr:UDP-N-acetyl-D-galactosamine dehydrogenase [Alphaproteobacteria bacterium]